MFFKCAIQYVDTELHKSRSLSVTFKHLIFVNPFFFFSCKHTEQLKGFFYSNTETF